MSNELNFLRVLGQCKSYYERFMPLCQEHMLSKETKQVIKDLGEWYKSQNEVYDWQEFGEWFKLVRHPKLKKEQVEIYDTLFSRLSDDPGSLEDELLTDILKTYIKRDYATRIWSLTGDIADGTDDATELYEVEDMVEEWKDEVSRYVKEDHAVVTDDIYSLVERVYSGGDGLAWRLACLNKAVGPLRQGDFALLGARPEVGKTSWLASESTFMASQMNPDQYVLWFNNEEEGRKVKLRVIQSAIAWTTTQIAFKPKEAYDEYLRIMGGRDPFVVYDEAAIYPKNVLNLIETYKPGLIIFDQLRKLRGWEKSTSGEVERLARLFGFGRQLAKDHCPVICVHQARGDAEGLKWIPGNMLHGVQTDPQGELDLQIMMGKSHEDGTEDYRYLNLVKNKMAGGPGTDPAYKHGQFEVEIKPEIGRFEG